jgi:hypothetical protein
VHAAITAAYHAKRDHYGRTMVGTVVGLHAEAVTLQLLPRSSYRTGSGAPSVAASGRNSGSARRGPNDQGADR